MQTRNLGQVWWIMFWVFLLNQVAPVENGHPSELIQRGSLSCVPSGGENAADEVSSAGICCLKSFVEVFDNIYY